LLVDLIKPTLKPPGIKRLYSRYDELLSNFAFKFNLRRYTLVQIMDKDDAAVVEGATMVLGRGLHSFTFQLSLWDKGCLWGV
jgi:hypothetical protein